jgi:hypothetical protein
VGREQDGGTLWQPIETLANALGDRLQECAFPVPGRHQVHRGSAGTELDDRGVQRATVPRHEELRVLRAHDDGTDGAATRTGQLSQAVDDRGTAEAHPDGCDGVDPVVQKPLLHGRRLLTRDRDEWRAADDFVAATKFGDEVLWGRPSSAHRGEVVSQVMQVVCR